jgi:hypothetical protein
MSITFAKTFQTTGRQLIERFSNEASNGQLIEAWIFADREKRQSIERSLLNAGVKAKVRSAYKPLLHFMLEDLNLNDSNLKKVEVFYPVHPKTTENRFLLEAYPLAALTGKAEIVFHPDHSSDQQYRVVLHSRSGMHTEHKVFAPNHIHTDVINQEYLSPTGWLKVHDENGELTTDERLETDYEQLFKCALDVVTEHNWTGKEPFFERLSIDVELPWPDQSIGYEQENVSLTEALHEDLYFSLQEWFKVKAGYQPKDREGQPGQIVPSVIHSQTDELTLTMCTQPYNMSESRHLQPIEAATEPLSTHQIAQELAQISGTELDAHSVSGRKITARYHQGSDIPVMISGGQHANETTGVVGALRGALELARQQNTHFVISPLENPDGYSLHQALIKDNPFHMHHAARYTALGDDLEYRKKGPMYEKEIRFKAREISQAKLHINLHGYPSHEWVRPFSGYVPLGFDMWTIPKGFFLILRHYPTDFWREYTFKFTERLTEKLMSLPGVSELNQKQVKLYNQHAGMTNFELINGFPCLISESKETDIPLQLITEYPDETIYGALFIQGHEVQKHTVVYAYEIHQQLMGDLNSPS